MNYNQQPPLHGSVSRRKPLFVIPYILHQLSIRFYLCSSFGVVRERIQKDLDNGYTLEGDGRLYKYFSNTKSFVESVQLCIADDSVLASPYPADLKQIVDKYSKPGVSMALGLLAMKPATGIWHTFDGNNSPALCLH